MGVFSHVQMLEKNVLIEKTHTCGALSNAETIVSPSVTLDCPPSDVNAGVGKMKYTLSD